MAWYGTTVQQLILIYGFYLMGLRRDKGISKAQIWGDVCQMHLQRGLTKGEDTARKEAALPS